MAPVTRSQASKQPVMENGHPEATNGNSEYKFMQPPLKFRPAGAPAGSWHHTPWWVCVFHDPYERINFWSHFVPGVTFICLGIAALLGLTLGGKVMTLFCGAAAVTHMFSATTHIWPDDHVLEKLDHLGIIALIVGTPFTAVVAKDPEGDLTIMAASAAALVAAAFLRPVLRTISFVSLGAVIFFSYFQMVNANLVGQVVLYLAGAYAFVRNGGHDRWPGLTDHHLLHYWVTMATILHVFYIRHAVTHQIHHEHPSIVAHT